MIQGQSVVHEVTYSHPPERVWRALVDPDELAAWLMPNDFAAVVDRQFTMSCDPYGTIEAEVLQRLRSEATFAHLCGASPMDASSGKNERHRLNRGGDPNANSALWHIVFTRMVCDPRTRHYIERRIEEGRTKKDAVRCLKRYVAREVYQHLPRQKFPLTIHRSIVWGVGRMLGDVRVFT